MDGSLEVVKGRIEEAAGALVANDRLRAKGKTDQVVGHVKQVGEQGIRQIGESVHDIVAHARVMGQRAVRKTKRMY
jgi:uncharacterized protein YjbJ (UPF0337 family)